MWKNSKSFYSGNQIESESAKAYLVKVPGSDFKVWINKSQTRWSGSNVRFGFNIDWSYKLFQNGKGKYNKFEKVAEKEVSGAELLQMFGE